MTPAAEPPGRGGGRRPWTAQAPAASGNRTGLRSAELKPVVVTAGRLNPGSKGGENIYASQGTDSCHSLAIF